MKKFVQYDTSQLILLPPALQDWVPERHLARVIDQIIDGLELKSFFELYKGGGRPAFNPKMMLKLIFYGACTKRFSSREIEAATYDDIAFRFLSADQHPDHASIAAFKVRHKEHFHDAFVKILGVARSLGLVKLGFVAFDGHKFLANAAKRHSYSLEQLREKAKELQKSIEEAESIPDKNPNILTELNAARLELDKIKAASEELEKRIASEQEAREELVPVPASRWDRTLNEATAAAGKRLAELRRELGLSQSQLGHACKVRRELVCKWEKNARRPSPTELAVLVEFLGHFPPEFQAWRHQGQTIIKKVKPSDAIPRINTTDPDSILMKPNRSASTIQCYNGQSAVDSYAQIVVGVDIADKPHDRECLIPMLLQIQRNLGCLPEIAAADNGFFSLEAINQAEQLGVRPLLNPGRVNKTFKNPDPFIQAVREQFKDPEVKKLYNQRAAVVEPVYGRIKTGLRFVRTMLRGKLLVKADWIIINTAHNLLKMAPTVLNKSR